METPVSEGLVSKRSLRKKSVQKNYDENVMDEFIEKHIGGSFRKIRTKEELEKETETEAMIALSLGFPIDALIEEEIKAGVVKDLGGKEQNDYIVVRNHILSRWRSNVRIWLTRGQIKETVSNEYVHLLSAAYDFLLYNGYINFGVSPSFSAYLPEEATEGSVIIVGAGLAGLAAARQLLSFGFKVVVIEGRNRPGGRVYTQQMGKKDKHAAVELGGSVITGIHANPLGVLARQLSIPLHKVRDNCPLYRPNGEPVKKEIDSRIETIFNKLLDKVNELRKIMGGFANHISLGSVLEKLRQLYAVAKSPEERQLWDWHLANLEYANAGSLSDLSAAYWDQDDPYEMGGDHCFLAGGNWRLIKALCDGVPIMYGKTVDTIRYGVDGVEVVAGNQAFQADMVLCTVPLGVLKKKIIRFEPELPQRKLAAIDRLGFGLLNKVAMIFPHVFWGEELDTFGCLNDISDSRGEFFLFYSYHTVSGGPVLIALVAGEAAQTFERTDPSLLVHRVLSKLRGIYGPKGVDVPDPTQTICTRWGNDRLSYGSYSHVRVQSSGKDYDILAESVGNRLFFAGEATTRQYPATMHGAYLSGLREASRILRARRGRQNYRRSVQRNVGQSSDLLVDLFNRPDLVFGNFSFVFNPLTEDPKSLGLLRITFDNRNDDMGKVLEKTCDPLSNQPLHLYTMLSREQTHELQMVTEEENKLVYLIKNLGLKLMGANALGTTYNSLVSSISNAKRGKGRGLRWASVNLGIFICKQCSRIHRSLGVHISKSDTVSPFAMHQQQLALLAHQQSILMAAAAKSAPGNTLQFPSNSTIISTQQQLALLAHQQFLLTAAAAKSAHGNAQQPLSTSTGVLTQAWPNVGYQIPEMIMPIGGQDDLQKLMQTMQMGQTQVGNNVAGNPSKWGFNYRSKQASTGFPGFINKFFASRKGL